MKHKLKTRTRKQWVFFGIGVVVTMVAAGFIVLTPGGQPALFSAATPIDKSEHTKTIAEIGKPKRERPVIAIVALNAATEVTDLMIPFGVLTRANVADVVIVAPQKAPVSLYPISKISQGSELFKITPHTSMQTFDTQYPNGADYIVVPALQPRNDTAVVKWLQSQHRKGAHVVSVCAGALTVAAAGLLDNRRATTHWSYTEELQKAHPNTRIIKDRRYVSDRGVTTSTGISASIPTMVAVVEAIAGQQKAQQVAQQVGITYWDARHRSATFELTWEHKKTYLRSWLLPWRQETIGVPVGKGVDEIALALTVDAYSRTTLSSVQTVATNATPIYSKYGLAIQPNTHETANAFAHMLPAPTAYAPAQTIDRELKNIAKRYGPSAASVVALTMEYPQTTTY